MKDPQKRSYRPLVAIPGDETAQNSNIAMHLKKVAQWRVDALQISKA